LIGLQNKQGASLSKLEHPVDFVQESLLGWLVLSRLKARRQPTTGDSRIRKGDVMGRLLNTKTPTNGAGTCDFRHPVAVAD
jgi:hypothetical protein